MVQIFQFYYIRLWLQFFKFLLMVITSCHLAFTSKNGVVYKVNASIPCSSKHSFSLVIAISDFLLNNFPEIIPPYPQALKEKIQQHATSELSPLSDFWSAYLVQSIQKELACRQGNEFYIIVPLDDWNEEISKKELLQVLKLEGLSELSAEEQIKKIFNVSPTKSTKKIGIYRTHPNQSQFLPYLTMHFLILGILFNNQKWKIYNINRKQVPSVEDLLTFDAIYITGSSYCVLNQNEQIALSLKNLMQAFNQSKKLKIAGTCYGHQIIAHHYGSSISTKPMIRGMEAIEINKQVAQMFPFLDGLRSSEVIHINESHSDHVDIVPNGFQLLASSKSCGVQALVSQDGRIYTTQFHPEIMYQYVEVLESALKGSGIEQFGYDFNIEKGLDIKNAQDSVIILESIQSFIDQ